MARRTIQARDPRTGVFVRDPDRQAANDRLRALVVGGPAPETAPVDAVPNRDGGRHTGDSHAPKPEPTDPNDLLRAVIASR